MNKNKYELINESTYEMTIESKKYGNHLCLIDKDDFDRCKDIRWCLHKVRVREYETYFYVQTSDSRFKGLLLHRYIANATKVDIVDHSDKNTMNNKKENLRVCDRSQNGQNRKIQINNISGITGVRWDEKLPVPKWVSYIMIDKGYKSLGYFDTMEEAIKSRREAEIKYFGDFRNKESL